MTATTHHAIRERIRARIKAGEYPLGARIPGEAEFAEAFGCSRTTVNRALRALADEGIVERRRKGGTRVRPLPVPQAQLTIPLVREQVEATRRRYTHRLLARGIDLAAGEARARMRLGATAPLMHLETLHLADGRPFAFERRWVNLEAVPAFASADLSVFSANEWLVREVPFSNGEVSLSAASASERAAEALAVPTGTPLFTLDRTTWFDEAPITTMTLSYRPPFALDFAI